MGFRPKTRREYYIYTHRVIQRRTDRLTRLTDPSPTAASSTHLTPPRQPEECRRRQI